MDLGSQWKHPTCKSEIFVSIIRSSELFSLSPTRLSTVRGLPLPDVSAVPALLSETAIRVHAEELISLPESPSTAHIPLWGLPSLRKKREWLVRQFLHTVEKYAYGRRAGMR